MWVIRCTEKKTQKVVHVCTTDMATYKQNRPRGSWLDSRLHWGANAVKNMNNLPIFLIFLLILLRLTTISCLPPSFMAYLQFRTAQCIHPGSVKKWTSSSNWAASPGSRLCTCCWERGWSHFIGRRSSGPATGHSHILVVLGAKRQLQAFASCTDDVVLKLSHILYI